MFKDRCSYICSRSDVDGQMLLQIFTCRCWQMLTANRHVCIDRCSHVDGSWKTFQVTKHRLDVHTQMFTNRYSHTNVHKQVLLQMFTCKCWQMLTDVLTVTCALTDVHTQMGFETWIPEVFPKSRSVLVVDPTWVEEELSSCLSDPISSCLSDPRSKTLSDPRSSSLSEPRSSLGLLVFKIPFTGKQGTKNVYQPKTLVILNLNFKQQNSTNNLVARWHVRAKS